VTDKPGKAKTQRQTATQNTILKTESRINMNSMKNQG